MLQCARQCGRRNGTTPFLTFGEFCVFARELQKPKSHRKVQLSPISKHSKDCAVFLGGSCNPTTWRTDTAIPELQKHGITYYNPQRSIWGPELVAEEHDAKQSASVLLEYVDLVRGQSSLLTLLKIQGVKVYINLMSALQRTTSILHSTSNGKAEEQLTNKLRKLREIFDSYDVNGTGELHLNDVLDGYYRLTKKTLQISELYNYLSNLNVDKNKMRISFEQFCALVAEFSSDNCTTINDDWASQPLQRQCSTNNNTHCDIDNTHANCNTSNNLNERKTFINDIYLGGSLSTQNKWRENIAIPLLKRHGLTYYNPTIREANMEIDNECFHFNIDSIRNNENFENCFLQWKDAIDKSKVLLFVVTNDTKSLTTMILAAHYIGSDQNNVVLCVEQLPSHELQTNGEKLTTQAIKDYNRGRVYLSDVAKRKKVPVFENVTEAVQCAINKCQER
ncbi:hypothetical protein FQR65_LT19080 [Abscondita terminalis]|nr:hypothetical protein FQR65_LT19080 [Abscondita terminalis]